MKDAGIFGVWVFATQHKTYVCFGLVTFAQDMVFAFFLENRWDGPT